MGKTITVEVEVPKGVKAGQTFQVEVDIPTPVKKPRGQLAGIELVDMTDDQLKRELINSKSVLYKATQRGAAAETILANQARVDAATAEKEKRNPVKVAETPNVDAAMTTEEVYAEI
jgi:outer membrane translocation and assembly module TamA